MRGTIINVGSTIPSFLINRAHDDGDAGAAVIMPRPVHYCLKQSAQYVIVNVLLLH